MLDKNTKTEITDVSEEGVLFSKPFPVSILFIVVMWGFIGFSGLFE